MSDIHSERPRALVIGAMNLDVLAIAGQKARPAESTPGAITTSAGGVGRNIAEGMARLGVNTGLLSVVGQDDAAVQLLSHCRIAGINTAGIVAVDGFNTSSYVSLHSEDGALLYAISDMHVLDAFGSDHIPELQNLLINTDLCVIDSNLPEGLIRTIAEKADDTTLVADAVSVAKCRRLLDVLPKLSLLKVNRQEAQALSGCSPQASLPSVIENTLALGPASLLITLGAEGALLATIDDTGLHILECPSPEVEVVSVNGAGDSLLAGFLAAGLYGHDQQEQLRWGNVAAAHSLATQDACSSLLSLNSMQ